MKYIFLIVLASVLMASVVFISLTTAALVELKASIERRRKL